MDLISLLASIASLILAVVAIGLSIIFFKMSSELSKTTTEAAKGIGASVERLENLFDKLYSDTFSMMKDTVQDMRKHIWPADAAEEVGLAQETEEKADKKIEELKKSVYQDLSSVLNNQKIADENLKDIRSEMGKLIERVIDGSRQVDVEAKEETLRALIIRELLSRTRRSGLRSVPVAEIVQFLQPVSSVHETRSELERMNEEGVVELSDDLLSPSTHVRLVGGGVRRSRAAARAQAARTQEEKQGI